MSQLLSSLWLYPDGIRRRSAEDPKGWSGSLVGTNTDGRQAVLIAGGAGESSALLLVTVHGVEAR